jgi:hydroxyquinol 1,2-dioxygenase
VQRTNAADALAMRGRFRTDEDGRFWFWSIKPAAYPVPHDGPVGEMLKAQGRHPWRPAHVHFMISAPGCEPLVSHVFVAGEQYLDSDVVFGVKDSLVCEFKQLPAGTTVADRTTDRPSYHLDYDFTLKGADQMGRRSRLVELNA